VLKLVSVVFMFFVTAQCCAVPVHRSNLQDSCAPEEYRELTQEEIEEQDEALQQVLQRRLERDPMLVTRRLQEEMRLAEQIAQREAEVNRTLMALPRPHRVARINALRNKLAEVQDPNWVELQRGIIAQARPARQQAIREEERYIAVQREFQARQRTAIRMMEQVQQLQQEDGWISGCSVM
jgi:hypothetical protein